MAPGCALSWRRRRDAGRVRRAQPGQSTVLRADRERAQERGREEPVGVRLARAGGLPQGGGPAGGRPVAAAPGAAAGPGGRLAAGRGGRAGRRRAGAALMYPSRFRYEVARSVEQASRLLHDGGDDAKVVAGGQILIPMMKLRFAAPELLVDINAIGGLDYHRIDPDGSIHVGALCRHADLEHSDLLPGRQPTMTAAAPLIADPLVRNRGTLVGSLCHADPQGDWASVVLALGGSIVAQGPAGQRVIPLREFVLGPFENALAHDEIAVEAVIPAPRGAPAGGYLKLERRVGDFATAGVAVALETDGSQVVRAGIALTGVGGATIEATAAQEALTGRPLTAETIAEAGRLAAEAAQPKSDHRGSATYKRHMVRTFVVRILGRIEGSQGTAERAA